MIYICHQSSEYWPHTELIFVQDGSVSIQDKFEYIMHGRLYNIEGCSKPEELEVYVHFFHIGVLLFLFLLKVSFGDLGCSIKSCFTSNWISREIV